MATNTFKNAKARNVGTSPVSLYTVPSGKTSVVLQCDAANVAGVAINVSIYIVSGGNNYYMLKNGNIPIGQTLQGIYGQKLVLQAGEILTVVSDTATSSDWICSVLEDV